MARVKNKKVTKSTGPSAEVSASLKLDLGCGKFPREGFKGVDVSSEVKADYVHDLKVYPWPFKDNSVEEVHCSHFLEHLDGIERIAFFNELYRIMKPNAQATFITPAPFTHRYMQDPTHKFPMVVQEFYNYLHAESRKSMGLEHYPLKCNFEWSGRFNIDPTSGLTGRNDEYIADRSRYNINVLADLIVILVKK